MHVCVHAHVHAHAGTRVHEATSLTGLVTERVQLTVHTTEPTGTVPEPFHCDHIARWSARTGTSGRSGTGLNTGNWNGSGTVLVSNLWCEHGLIHLDNKGVTGHQCAISRRVEFQPPLGLAVINPIQCLII